MIKRLQNKIAESRLTLHVTSVIAISVWLAYGLVQKNLWYPFICFAVTTYLMVELNNSNSLIRIYSRLVSCSFMFMMCSSVYLFTSLNGGIIEVCTVLFYLLFLKSFQNRDASGWVFYAFLCVGVTSVLFIQILFYVPLLWIMLSTKMTALNWRTFFASLLGLLLPYWFLAGYYSYVGNFSQLVTHFAEIADFGNIADIFCVNIYHILTFALVLLCAIIGTVHFVRNSVKDKIRTRMIYEMFITINVATMVFIILQPRHFDILIRIAIINTAPLIAHFISLTHTKLTNIVSLTLMAMAMLPPVVTYFLGLWTPLLTF
ncbi:MAG: hypothetical protein SOZ80_09170 [Prevotella sp.]|uniref:hypothetical protein n=1 Tax=Prevotella sp. TaxID=59823 RepID=UPI002A277372|nr:hypothetical protein [Prevotella sp.]MDD7318185.1 hypothetical protein [Prevotellaceae bacterium]MDY4020926.1 hypothetical protein [Prevotella sp.]